MGGNSSKVSGGVRSSNKQPGLSSSESRSEKASESIKRVLDDIDNNKYTRTSAFTVGDVEKRMKDYAKRNDITLSSKCIYMSPKQIAHAVRESKKDVGKTVSRDDLIGFPKNYSKMSLYFDKNKKNFVYTDGATKFVIHPNYSMKIHRHKMCKVNFLTASKTDGNEFNMKNYVLVN